MVISLTASGFGGVYRCMRGGLMWTCLVWAERSTPDNLWVPSHHRFNSATGEQKGITETIILTPSRPVGCLTHQYQAPSREVQISHFLRLWCDAVGDQTPTSRTPSGRSNHYGTRGRGAGVGDIGRGITY